MAGLFGLSIDPQVYSGNFPQELFLGTFYEQHLGEKYGGLAVKNSKSINIQTHKGLFRPMFGPEVEEFQGTEGIGYCGSAREPFLVESRTGEFCACFSGNIINRPQLVTCFKDFGHNFCRGGDDIEIITKLIAQEDKMVEGIKRADSKTKGAFSIVILAPEGIYAARCSSGHWPMVIGEKNGAVAVASESISFSNLGFKILRDLKPGEIVLLKEGQWSTVGQMSTNKIQICSFVWVYTSSPVSVFEGIPASEVRKRLGAALASRDIENGFFPHIVAPIPDSGRFHAIGYHQEFCRQMNDGLTEKVPLYDEALVKYPYAGRSFTPDTDKERSFEAFVKILPSGERFYRGKQVVVCDDSIVRGVQTREGLIPKLRILGIKGIHLRISNPELWSHCRWGKTTRRGEVLVAKYPTEKERINFLGVQSLKYNTIDDLIEAINLPRESLCVDCDLPEQEIEQ
jgi:amidophosphoribosyltransferase